MVERIEDRAVEREPVDEAGIEIGHEELLRRRVEYEAAEGRAAIGSNGREQRDLAGLAIDLPDAAGIARRAIRTAPLPGHEARGRVAEGGTRRHTLGVRHRQIEAEGGSC